MIGSIFGDTHDIGKNIVARMLSGAEFDVIDLLCEKGLRDRFAVIIGGKPCSLSFAEKTGADGHFASAPGAVRLVKKIMAELKCGFVSRLNKKTCPPYLFLPEDLV